MQDAFSPRKAVTSSRLRLIPGAVPGPTPGSGLASARFWCWAKALGLVLRLALVLGLGLVLGLVLGLGLGLGLFLALGLAPVRDQGFCYWP